MDILRHETENGTIVIKIVDVTPTYAKELLGYNTDNRNLKKRRIEMYANDMQNGNWKSNGMPIIVGNDNVLKDGQHRLLACVKSNTTLKDQIVIFLPECEANCYDIGVSRTVGDVLKYEGINDPAFHSTNLIGGINFIIKMIDKGKIPTKLETIDKMLEYQDACLFVYKNLIQKSKNINGLRRAGAIAALICAYLNGYPFDKLQSFCECLVTGIPNSKIDIGIIKLRDYLMNNRSTGYDTNEDIFARTQNMLKAYEDNRIVSVCRATSNLYYNIV